MSANQTSRPWDELARSAATAVPASAATAPLLQLLTFSLDGSPYALPIERVREIVRLRPITAVPRVPEEVLGVISLRGEIVQVVDLRRRLGLSPGDAERTTRIVIVLGEAGLIVGLLVDAVTEVVSVPEDSLQPPTGESEAVSALCSHEDRFISLIDLDKLWMQHAEH
jgi:purine-binding chemotaxis protein CheW